MLTLKNYIYIKFRIYNINILNKIFYILQIYFSFKKIDLVPFWNVFYFFSFSNMLFYRIENFKPNKISLLEQETKPIIFIVLDV